MPRLQKGINFTTKNGSLRKRSPHYVEQAAKEWVIWGDDQAAARGGRRAVDVQLQRERYEEGFRCDWAEKGHNVDVRRLFDRVRRVR